MSKGPDELVTRIFGEFRAVPRVVKTQSRSMTVDAHEKPMGVSSIELFFDLVFVFVITQVTQLVEHTALIVSDPYDLLEAKRSVTYWLFHRRGTLEPQAFGICTRTSGFAYTVLFRHAAGAGRPVGRGVSMDSTYGSLRMVHGDFEFPGVLTIG